MTELFLVQTFAKEAVLKVGISPCLYGFVVNHVWEGAVWFKFCIHVSKQVASWVAAELHTEHSRDSQVFVQKCLYNLAIALSSKNNYYNNRLIK